MVIRRRLKNMLELPIAFVAQITATETVRNMLFHTVIMLHNLITKISTTPHSKHSLVDCGGHAYI